VSDDETGTLLPFPEGGVDPRAEELIPVLEALLFAAGGPVKVRELCEALDGAEPRVVQGALGAMKRRMADANRGIELVQVSGAWQLRTDPRFAGPVLTLLGTRPARLSRAALEVLSVVAYQQPVTRGDVEKLRGVDCGGVMRVLAEKGLIRVSGRRDQPGRPHEYRTTAGFLQLFGLPGLDHLPTLRERQDLDPDA